LNYARRSFVLLVFVSVWLALAGCTTTGRQDDAAAKQATQDRLNDRIAAADKALKAGHPDEAIEQLDAAVKIDPSSKAPWLKKAQIYFDGHQYGPAITASQEVLQRDVTDVTAKSILAVSGLRVSADALEQLRKVNEVNGSTRSEAEAVAKLIHETLGETILVAQPASAPDTPKANHNSGRSWRHSRHGASATHTASAGASQTSGAASGVKSSSGEGAMASNGRNNPFGALQ
jgi:tetratricopeptide (TPR) repeat protein